MGVSVSANVGRIAKIIFRVAQIRSGSGPEDNKRSGQLDKYRPRPMKMELYNTTDNAMA